MELKEAILWLKTIKVDNILFAKEEFMLPALQTAISHLEIFQEERQLRIKYQDIIYQICRLFDTTKNKCRIDEVVNKVKTIQELILGKGGVE